MRVTSQLAGSLKTGEFIDYRSIHSSGFLSTPERSFCNGRKTTILVGVAADKRGFCLNTIMYYPGADNCVSSAVAEDCDRN